MKVALALTCVMVLQIVPAAQAAGTDWMTSSQKGYIFYQGGKLPEALQLYQSALSQFDTASTDELSRTDLLLVIAEIHTQLHHVDESAMILNQVQPIVFKKKYDNKMVQARYYRRLRTLRIASKDWSAAAEAQRRITEIVSLNFGPNSERALSEVSDLELDMLKSGNLVDAMSAAKRLDDAIPLVRGKSTINNCKEGLRQFFNGLTCALSILAGKGKYNEITPIVSRYEKFKTAPHERAASLIAVGNAISSTNGNLQLRIMEQLAQILKDTPDLSAAEKLAYCEALYRPALPSMYAKNISIGVRNSLGKADTLSSALGFANRQDTLRFVQIRAMYCWAIAATGDAKLAREKWSELESRFGGSNDQHILVPIMQSGIEIAALSKNNGETEAGYEIDRLVRDMKRRACK